MADSQESSVVFLINPCGVKADVEKSLAFEASVTQKHPAADAECEVIRCMKLQGYQQVGIEAHRGEAFIGAGAQLGTHRRATRRSACRH